MEVFICHIGPFPIENLERRTHIRFSVFEEKLIQVWYSCYLIKAWEKHDQNGEVLPSECSGTPDELSHIFRAFHSLSEDERERLYVRYTREIHDIVRGGGGVHYTIHFEIEGRYTVIMDGILRKLSNLEKSLALGMSMHPRLGQNSMVHALPHELVRRIWTRVPE
jgi:hypothetical protein